MAEETAPAPSGGQDIHRLMAETFDEISARLRAAGGGTGSGGGVTPAVVCGHYYCEDVVCPGGYCGKGFQA